MEELLFNLATRANRYIKGLAERSVPPSAEAVARLKRLEMPFQDEPLDPAQVLAKLDEIGYPATLKSTVQYDMYTIASDRR